MKFRDIYFHLFIRNFLTKEKEKENRID